MKNSSELVDELIEQAGINHTMGVTTYAWIGEDGQRYRNHRIGIPGKMVMYTGDGGLIEYRKALDEALNNDAIWKKIFEVPYKSKVE